MIIKFKLILYRFTLVFSTGVSVTAMEWNKYRINEILIALSNNELRCYNISKYTSRKLEKRCVQYKLDFTKSYVLKKFNRENESHSLITRVT